MNSEVHRNYTVLITLPSGEVIRTRKLAVNHWHAIDKAYYENNHLQDDRHEYRVSKRLLKVR